MAARDFLDSARYAREAYPRIPYRKPETEKAVDDLLLKPLFDWDKFVEANYRQLMERIDNEIRGGNTMEKTLKKKDLRSGYVVEFRCGLRRLVARSGMFTQILINPDSGRWNYLQSGWRDDLTACDDRYRAMCEAECPTPKSNPRDYDIVKVWGLVKSTSCYAVSLTTRSDGRDLLWEREKPVKKLTVNEISKLLGYEVEIVGETE
jgi:hypothetical protein